MEIAAASNKIHEEAVDGSRPVSNGILQIMGGSINYALSNLPQVGDVVESFLDETNFQALRSADWWLADGRSALGTDFNLLTGLSNVPDLRGVVLRGKNYARSTSTGNPDGDLTVGTYQADQLASHHHGGNFLKEGGGGANAAFGTGAFPSNVGGQVTDTVGGNETRMRNVTVNFYVKVN